MGLFVVQFKLMIFHWWLETFYRRRYQVPSFLNWQMHGQVSACLQKKRKSKLRDTSFVLLMLQFTVPKYSFLENLNISLKIHLKLSFHWNSYPINMNLSLKRHKSSLFFNEYCWKYVKGMPFLWENVPFITYAKSWVGHYSDQEGASLE